MSAFNCTQLNKDCVYDYFESDAEQSASEKNDVEMECDDTDSVASNDIGSLSDDEMQCDETASIASTQKSGTKKRQRQKKKIQTSLLNLNMNF